MNIVELNPPEIQRVPVDYPVVFLAGPIQGAPNWQAAAIDHLSEPVHHDSKPLYIANPRRETIDDEFVYEPQVDWEKLFLIRATVLGCASFWLAKQDLSLPHKKGRAYAQTTRIEFGRVAGWKDYDPDIPISLGIEPGYEGNERYYRHTAAEFGLTVHDNLDDLCSDTMKNVLEGMKRYG